MANIANSGSFKIRELPHPVDYEGSKDGIKLSLMHPQIQEQFREMAEKHRWKIQVDKETYVLRTKQAGYILHPESDKGAGCFVPKNFDVAKIRSDDTPSTKEAAKQLFQDIRFIMRHSKPKECEPGSIPARVMP